MKRKPKTYAEAQVREKLVEGITAALRTYKDANEARWTVKGDCQGEYMMATAAEIAPKSPTPFDMVEDATARVGNVANRVSALAARLVGETPTGSDGSTGPARSGQLGTVADRADSIVYAVNAMHAALDRIEAQLP